MLIENLAAAKLGAVEAFVILSSKERRTDRGGRPFYLTKVRDRTRTLSAPVWHDSPAVQDVERIVEGSHIRIFGSYVVSERFGGQIEIQGMRLVSASDRSEGYSPESLELRSRFGTEEMLRSLLATVRSRSPSHLADVVCDVLLGVKPLLESHPAATKVHHAFPGGLLEHTLSVVGSVCGLVDRYAEYYPEMKIDGSVAVSGAALHDIGKVFELRKAADGVEYSPEGELIGHIQIGRDMLRDAYRARSAKDGPFGAEDDEWLVRVEHVILSHQGRGDWGSPQPPKTPEAFIVHYADDLDAKMASIASAYAAAGSRESGMTEDSGGALRRRMLVPGAVVGRNGHEKV
jgi:3'-5' exoribonuclease